ncbi:MAG TPA: hypothetical protein VNT51_03185 [Miltoncostaeaceae bacterium]|nr:hypothetical protein [Miltoncostaeaceae bacterium]
MTPGGHPTDEEREARVLGVLTALRTALETQDGGAAAATLRDDACWLARDGRHEGAGAAHRARAFAEAAARRWSPPQQKGAHAVLRWSAPGEAAGAGALVVEARGDRIVLVCETP